MATELKLRKGTTAEHSTFTGAEAEVTVDTDKETVVVHDGTTAGGFPLAKENSIQAGNSSVEVVDAGTGYVAVTVDGSETARFKANGELEVAGASDIGGSTNNVGIFGSSGANAGIIGTTANQQLNIYGNGTGSIVFQTGGAYSNGLSVLGTDAAEIDSSANFKFNSGYGSVATAYGCRAWVNFNGTGTPAIREDGNVSSITDNGTGDYTVNFTTAMPDANYCFQGTASQTNTGRNGSIVSILESVPPTTTAFRFRTQEDGVGIKDMVFTNLAVFR